MRATRRRWRRHVDFRETYLGDGLDFLRSAIGTGAIGSQRAPARALL
jgi:hypothetical protein